MGVDRSVKPLAGHAKVLIATARERPDQPPAIATVAQPVAPSRRENAASEWVATAGRRLVGFDGLAWQSRQCLDSAGAIHGRTTNYGRLSLSVNVEVPDADVKLRVVLLPESIGGRSGR
jgi:hypothetical protein